MNPEQAAGLFSKQLRWTIHGICCRRTYSFSALLVLLRYPPEGLHRQGSAAETQFNDLVVKCLIKLTKALSTTMDVSFLKGSLLHSYTS